MEIKGIFEKFNKTEAIIFDLLLNQRISNLINDTSLFTTQEINYINSLICSYNQAINFEKNDGIVIILKSTRLCNLRCVYCNSWKEGPNQIMQFENLSRIIFEVITQLGNSQIEFVWHGGEPLLLPIKYYKKAIALQNIFKAKGQNVTNSIQSNGTKITNEWLDFFIEYNIDIGISLDGLMHLNDSQRLYKNGSSSFNDVIKGMQLCKQREVNYGVLIVIDKPTILEGEDFFLEMLKELPSDSFGLLNVIPSNKTNNICDEHYVSHTEYIHFLKNLYPKWNANYRTFYDIRDFTSLEKGIELKKPFMCYFGGNCHLQYLTIEPNGNISACDKYIGNTDYEYGNINEIPLKEILENSKKANNVSEKYQLQFNKFKKCEWIEVCQGGCPHDNLLNNLYQNADNKECCGTKPLLEVIKSLTNKIK